MEALQQCGGERMEVQGLAMCEEFGHTAGHKTAPAQKSWELLPIPFYMLGALGTGQALKKLKIKGSFLTAKPLRSTLHWAVSLDVHAGLRNKGGKSSLIQVACVMWLETFAISKLSWISDFSNGVPLTAITEKIINASKESTLGPPSRCVRKAQKCRIFVFQSLALSHCHSHVPSAREEAWPWRCAGIAECCVEPPSYKEASCR